MAWETPGRKSLRAEKCKERIFADMRGEVGENDTLLRDSTAKKRIFSDFSRTYEIAKYPRIKNVRWMWSWPDAMRGARPDAVRALLGEGNAAARRVGPQTLTFFMRGYLCSLISNEGVVESV